MTVRAMSSSSAVSWQSLETFIRGDAETAAAFEKAKMTMMRMEGIAANGSEPAAQIKWDQYKKQFRSQDIVQALQATTKDITYADLGDMTADEKATFDQMKKDHAELRKVAADAVKGAQQSLDQLGSVRSKLEFQRDNFDNVTFDQVLEENPELVERFHEDHRNDKW
jgi:tellurite resistance protein